MVGDMPPKLDCLTRRHLLNAAQAEPDKLGQIGRQLALEGFISDAIDFLAKAGDDDGLESLWELALDEGDYFLVSRISKTLGRRPQRTELERLAQRAAELGKNSFAAQALKQLEATPQ